MKRVVSMVLAVAMLVGMLPTTAWAAGDALSAGCCEHHQTHDDSCGYKAAIEGSNCTHQHTADCYEKEACIHTHSEECSVTCSHICSTDNGCITMQQECVHSAHDAACGGLDEENQGCNHTCEVVVDGEDSCYALLCSHAEPDVHDEVCGYVETVAEKACEYICEECAMEEADAAVVAEVKALIDAIPALDVVQEMSQDEQKSVYEQTQAAYDAYEKLTKDQKSQIPDANSFFEALFSYFNRMTSEINTDSALVGKCGENVTWELDTTAGTLVISGTGTMDNSWWPYETPSESPNFAPWHGNAENIKSVVINNGVTSIGHFAFFDCVNLTTISIPEGVTFIGCAFVGCDSLEELYIPASVTDFRYPSNEGVCTDLKKIIVDAGNSVYSSDEAGMLYNKGKTKFIGCPTGYQGAYTIADSVTEIGGWAFTECIGLTAIELPASLKTIGMSAFWNCSGLKELTLPDSVTTISVTAFAECYGISRITIPASVTSLQQMSFGNCTSLKEVYFEGSAPDIDYECFYGTTITAYYPDGDNSWLELVDDSYAGSIEWVPYGSGFEHEHSYTAQVTLPTCTEQGYTTHTCTCGDSYVDSYVEANGHSFGEWYETVAATTEAEGEECRDCANCDVYETRATEKLPAEDDEKETIGGNCGDSVTWFFNESSGILTITGTGAMADYKSSNFPWRSYASQIKQVNIDEGVTSIGNCAFYSCRNLESVLIADSVALIGESSFRDCENLTNLTVPEGVTRIGYCAFYDCESLTQIVIPDSVTDLGNSAFCGCKNIVSAELGTGITAISAGLFSGCKNLKVVSIDAAANSLGNSAFQNCAALETVHFGGTERAWNKMVLRDALEEDNEVLADVEVVFRAVDEVSFDGGNGTKETPYLLSNASQLDIVREDLLAHYVQTADIDFRGKEWTPIGFVPYNYSEQTGPFEGSYNGNSYKISNIHISEISNDNVSIGLFGYNDGVLKNIVLDNAFLDVNIDSFEGNGGPNYSPTIGGISGKNEGEITSCSVSGTINVKAECYVTVYVGGIVGLGKCSECINYAKVNATTSMDHLYCGGIVGFPGAINTIVDRCINYGDIAAVTYNNDKYYQNQLYCGGISGEDGSLYYCVNYGNITGSIYWDDAYISEYCQVGGLSGHNRAGYKNNDPNNGTFHCINFGNVYAYSSFEGVSCCAGGLFGRLQGEATNCYNLATSVYADLHVTYVAGGDDEYYSKVGRISGRGHNALKDSSCYSIDTTTLGAGTPEYDELEYGVVLLSKSQIYAAITDILTMLGLPVPEIKEESGGASVRYFRKWDKDTLTAFWGEEPPIVEGLDLGSQVTAETDTSFIANVDDLVGTYVLAATKTRDDGMIAADILLSIKPLETKTGTVTAIDSTKITIDGVEYSIPENVNVYDLNVGDSVMYHLYNGSLVGINGKGSNDDDNDDSAENISTVRYYSVWDVNNNVVQFGPNDYKGLQVTDETDAAFTSDPTKYLGEYVLVESKSGGEGADRDILISMKAVETKSGLVSSSNDSAIIVDGNSYNVLENLENPKGYVNQHIVYHLYEGNIVGIEILQTKEGFITYWDKTNKTLNIKEKADDELPTIYYLSPVSDVNEDCFLGESGSRKDQIQYRCDSCNIIYHMEYDNDYIAVGEFSYLTSDNNISIYKYTYNEDCFHNSSDDYQHELTKMSLRVTMAAGDVRVAGKADGAENIKDLMDKLGFNYSDDSIYYPDPTYDSIGYAMGSKQLVSSDGEKSTLIMIAVRGSGYGNEWGGNFRLGVGTDHEGFRRAADRVIEGLEEYIQKNDSVFHPRVKVWISGFSRAAATTNLVAAYLDDGNIERIDREDIFAFCFECPQNTTNSNANNSRYRNIVNIINPLDLVTKVAMSAWDFTRYGNNYYLPSQETLTPQDYSNKKYQMMEEYEKIIEYGSMEGDIDELTAEVQGQASALDDLTDILAATLKSRLEYHLVHENNFIVALAELFANGMSGNDMNLLKVIQAVPNLQSLLKPALINFTLNNGDLSAVNFNAHEMPLCLAWLDSINGIYADTCYRKIFVNCPVDVEVYQGETLVGKIANDVPVVIPNGIVTYVDSSGQKVIVLPVTSEYLIRLLATDSGNMTYTVTEYNMDSARTERVVSYYDVELTKGDCLNGTVESLNAVGKAKYPLALSDGQEAKPTIDQSGAEVKTFDVNVAVQAGGTAYGDDRYLNGEFAKVTAVANEGYQFVGWFVDGEKISTEAEYRFAVTGDMTITAQFTLFGHIDHVAGAEWISDGTYHWHTCTGCDEQLDVSPHSGGTATCTKKAACSVCGASYGELASHDYETSWSQGDANGHWHECKNCSAHDTQIKHTPGAAATSTTAQTCTVCGYVITPALGHTCTAGTKWYSNGTYHWHLCTSCGAWVKTSYHSYSGDTDETCNVCGYVRTVTATEPTEETEVAMTEATEATVSDEEVIAIETAPMTVSTEANENFSDDAVSENTDSHGVSSVLITVFAIVALGSLAALAILLVYKKRRKSE